MNFNNGLTNYDINTDLTEYTIDEILSLLNIDINKIDDYNKVNDIINENIDKYIKIFEGTDNKDLIIFFKSLKDRFSENTNNVTESEKLITNNNNYDENRKKVTKLLTKDSRFRKSCNKYSLMLMKYCPNDLHKGVEYDTKTGYFYKVCKRKSDEKGGCVIM